MIDHLLVVVNPLSGNGRAKRIARSFIKESERAGIESTLICILGQDVMSAQVRIELDSKKYDGVIIVGGDGLFHTLLPILDSSGVPFTVVAAGTGNDFSRAIRTFKKSNSEIITHLQQNAPARIDSMSIDHTGKRTLAGQVMSLGFDALVNERANQITYLAGKAKYVIAMFQVLATFRPIHFTITLDGRKFSRTAMLIAVANGPNYGGGMKICPPANHADGSLNLVVINKVSLMTLLMVFPRVYTGTHLRHPAVELFQGKSISIEADAKAFADGEYVDLLPVTAAVQPGALKVWTL
jgi:diacylglycerol kinase (ATP)